MAEVYSRGRLVGNLDELIKEADKNIPKALENEQELNKLQEVVIEAFADRILNVATVDALKGFLDDTYGRLMYRGESYSGEQITRGEAGNMFGEFLETDLFGVVPNAPGGRATELPDLEFIIKGITGRWEVKGTAGTINEMLQVGSLTIKVDSQVSSMEKQAIASKAAIYKILEKMRNFIYILLTPFAYQGKIHYEEIILYTQIVKEVIMNQMLYGRGERGTKPFFVEGFSDFKKKDDKFVRTIDVRLDEVWFKNLDNVKTLYKIQIDLLKKIKENKGINARIFGRIRELELKAM